MGKTRALAMLPLALSLGSCTVAASRAPSTLDDRLSIFLTVSKQIAAERLVDVAAVNPAPLPAAFCGCAEGSRQYLAEHFTRLEPETLDSFCIAPPPPDLSNRELRALGKPGPFATRSGRKTTPVAFSVVGFNRSHTQALTCAQQLHQADYWLLAKQKNHWAVAERLPAWMS